MEEDNGYWCVVCGRFLEANESGVITHDNVPHPENMSFDDDEESDDRLTECPFHNWTLDTGGECSKCGFDVRLPWKINRTRYWLWLTKQKAGKKSMADFLRNENNVLEYFKKLVDGHEKTTVH